MDIRNPEQQSGTQLDASQSESLKMPVPQWARAMVLALLASGCATFSKSHNDTAADEAASVIEEPIHCYRELKSLHGNPIPLTNDPVCDHPVPDAVSQTVEFTENIRTQSGKGESAYHLNTTIKPAMEKTEFCKTNKIDKWITPSSSQAPDQWPNEDLIGLSLENSDGNFGTINANMLLIDRELRTLSERGSHTQKTLKMYRIEKSTEGVRFRAEVIDCD